MASLISYETFEEIAVLKLKRKIRFEDNPDQHRSISAPINESQFLVAGPGSGKTTVMVLKILKFIFVDEVPTSSIVATTFTRKAAAELRSRILSWGDQIRQVLLNDQRFKDIHPHLRLIDFNQIITGTLDSISQDILKLHRAPGTAPPVVIQDFVTNALMLNVGLFRGDKHHNEDLRDYLITLRGGKFGFNTNEMARQLLEIKERVYYDQVDWEELRRVKENQHPGFEIAYQAINDYLYELESRSLYDFAMLEAEFLDQLKQGKLEKFLQGLKLILVDEYQDSNLLQEQIYFQLAKAAINNGGSMTVVGDDDQSLYRFRGATVDLFTNFQERYKTQIKHENTSPYKPELIYLSQNYRSTAEIVNFCNQFINLDQEFQTARVKDKPAIIPERSQPVTEFPILGMFREDVETLSEDLANFIMQVVCGEGYKIENYKIKVNPQEGSATDLSILISSPQERAFNKKKLPYHLRKNLKIPIFNPRGQNLEEAWETKVLCGLMLNCIDPQCKIQDSIEKMPYTAKKNFIYWRKTAEEYIESNPEPSSPVSLPSFVEAWQERKPLGRRNWKKVVPLLDLAYKLVTWIPTMQNDVEGLVYLEAIARTIAETALFSNYAGELIFNKDDPEHECHSITDAYWNIFVPLATGAIKVDEGLLETLPDNRINIMSIHQSKGLEFPLVIVDVGSDFRTNHPKNAFKRFPEEGGKSSIMEEEIRICSPLGLPKRSGRHSAFDDLTRHYFVAFSRAQDVLLLVGLNNYADIPNVATGWTRNGNWPWNGLDNLIMI
ncbi:MAG: ATP-dependent helicase [Methanobacteriaceae archaeon]|nr:ATP-dependent helicase [Methanobacteriaceae archaeon]